jgi:HK97 family phage prohead protease
MDKIITTKLQLDDVNPGLAKELGQPALIRKALVPALMEFIEGEHAAIAYITTGIVDRDHEIIEPTGVQFDHYLKNPIVLFSHNYSSLPIGKCVSIAIDQKGIIAKTIFANTEEANRIYQYLRDGFPLATSIGFVPIEYQDCIDEEINEVKVSRRYTKVSLLEYSFCAVPANPEALLLAVSKGLLPAEVEEKIWEESDGEIKHRIRDPKLFEQDSFRTIPIKKDSPKINAIAGKLKGETTMTLQSLRFPKDEGWDMEKARTWVKDHPDVSKELGDPMPVEPIEVDPDEGDIIAMLNILNANIPLIEHLNNTYPEVMVILKQKLMYKDIMTEKYQKLASSVEELVELIKKTI